MREDDECILIHVPHGLSVIYWSRFLVKDYGERDVG